MPIKFSVGILCRANSRCVVRSGWRRGIPRRHSNQINMKLNPVRAPHVTRRPLLSRPLPATVALGLLLCLLGTARPSAHAASYPFYDNFENGLGAWTTNNGWGLTPLRAHSPTRSVTDSPGSFYANHTDATLTLGTAVPLGSASRPVLSFWHQYSLEPGYDFGRVEVSTDNGSSWSPTPLANYTGSSSGMEREQLDLAPYAGSSSVRIRFRLVTDASVVMDGWYVDDVRIGETPAPVTLNAPATATPNSVQLSWSESPDASFAAYRVYRSLSPGVDWHTAQVVAEISTRSTTTATDITACPKTRYYYRVMVLNTDGLHALGNEIQPTRPPAWTTRSSTTAKAVRRLGCPTCPGRLSDEDAASPTRAWSDSPGHQLRQRHCRPSRSRCPRRCASPARRWRPCCPSATATTSRPAIRATWNCP